MRKLFRKVITSAQKMSYLPYVDKKDENRMFIEDNALEYIMLLYTDRIFGDKPNNKKYYNKIFGK